MHMLVAHSVLACSSSVVDPALTNRVRTTDYNDDISAQQSTTIQDFPYSTTTAYTSIQSKNNCKIEDLVGL